ncbi:MAG: DUF2267 domain-containing protein [Deltaproteobacteria bacterium]|nr:DUF2267 domain-containing protein [Deltaproteobacteria bacterium]
MERNQVDYEELLEAARDVGFLSDEESAVSAVQAVLGILAGRLGEPQARAFVSHLPEPLSYEKLRGQQEDVTDLTADQYVTAIAEEFDVARRDAKRLICSVVGSALGPVEEAAFDRFERDLPEDWKALLREC